MDHKTHTTKVVLDNGPWVGQDNPVTQASGFTEGLPDRIWGEDGFMWVVHYFEDDADATGLDMSSATAKIYIAADTDGASRTELGSGVVSGSNNEIITYTAPADTIPSDLYGTTCIVILEATNTTYQTTLVQRVEVNHYTKGIGSTPGASAMAYTPTVSGDWPGTDPDDVAEALDDLAERQTDTNLYGHLQATASDMVSRTTAGAAISDVEWASNDVNLKVAAFDDSTDEGVTVTLLMPFDWDASTLKAKFVWTNAGGGAAETVRYEIAARMVEDDASVDLAYGTAQAVDDTWLAQNDYHESAATSSDIVPAGTPAAGTLCTFLVTRDVATDDLTGDAQLIAVLLQYGKSFTAPTAW